MKWCGKCKKFKNPTEFHRNRSRKDGISGRCKVCSNVKRKRDYRGQYSKNKKKYSVPIKATRLVQQMVLSGRLKKEPCFFCGNERVDGHHIFYDHPAKVLWLCPDHHRKFHRVWKKAD